jgi:hypothetical protein
VIERPRRSVTRFFVPLIDVLILLFCIFLLMPYVSRPDSEVSGDTPPKDLEPTEPLPAKVTDLQKELELARREIKRLREEKGDLVQRISVRVLQIDPQTGRMYYFNEGERRDVVDQRDARRLIDLHQRQSGAREPFFVLVRPENSIYPLTDQAEQYNRWFQDVPHQFD